jgi:hypothetical protein
VHHLRLVYFFLTMLLATKNKPQMPFQLENYQKAPMQHGTNTKVVQECRTQHSNLEIKPSLKSCISQMTTQQCQDGSKAWRSSSGSRGCGQKRGLMLNVRDLNVLPRRPAAVAAASFSRNLILLHRNHTLKN